MMTIDWSERRIVDNEKYKHSANFFLDHFSNKQSRL